MKNTSVLPRVGSLKGECCYQLSEALRYRKQWEAGWDGGITLPRTGERWVSQLNKNAQL